MKRSFLLLAGAVVASALPAQAADRPSPEARLARAIEGRVAGEPVDCIDLRQARSSRVIQDTALIFEIGDTVYVNRPRAGADSLDEWDTQVTRPFGGRLCSIDPVNMIDPMTGMLEGVVFLDQFVPYRRASRD